MRRGVLFPRRFFLFLSLLCPRRENAFDHGLVAALFMLEVWGRTGLDPSGEGADAEVGLLAEIHLAFLDLAIKRQD